MHPISLEAAAPLPRWVGWKIIPRNGKPTKVPFDARTGQMAKADDPSTWAPRSTAEAWASQHVNGEGGGVGLELGAITEGSSVAIGGIDLDTCRDPASGKIEAWAMEVIERFGSYTEVSPSGTGVKIYFTYSVAGLPALRAAMGSDHSRAWKRGGEHPPAIELHLGCRYFAVTDQHLAGTPTDFRPVDLATLLWVVREAGPAFVANGKTAQPSATPEPGNTDALMSQLYGTMETNAVLARRWAGDTKGMSDGSRSALAMALGGLLKREGFSFEETCALLRRCEHTRDWVADKGEAAGDRELRRMWNRASTDTATSETTPWPPLRRDLATSDPLPAPPLNLADFPAPWPEWIERAAAGAGAPPDYVACALLAVTGATIGNARWGSPWEGWRQPPIVNMACIGLPSAGKSPAISAVADPAAELAGDLNDDFEERMRAWRTACQEAKERRALWEADVKAAVKESRPVPGEPAGARDPDKPRKRRIHSTDPTQQAARDLSAFNPRGLLLHRDELAGWIADMDRYGGGGGGGDRAFWLQAYEGSRWTSDRVKDGDEGRDVPHLTWGIVGGIQPDRLASMLLAGDDDGLSGRFLYTWPAPLADISDPPTGAGLPFALKLKLLRLRELPMPADPEPVVLPFTPEAVEALQDWRRTVKAMEAEAAGLYLSWLGKLPGMAVRLAVIFAHLEWLGRPAGSPPPEAVDLDAITRALAFLAEYAVPMARRAFGEAALPEAEKDARRLARWLLRQSPMPETLNARELRRVGGGPGIPTSGRIEVALAELAELRWVRPAPGREGGGKGRQRADWAVNPALRGAPS